ncbi:MAG: HD domain-containing protein [Lachnospiraceae bacterium]|nr:HD domain-containing protein [Lachnospiraceae bacterium]
MSRININLLKDRKVAIVVAALINVILAYICKSLGLPLYLDCIGIIVVAAIFGYLPGIMVAVFTNFFGGIYQEDSLYFVLVSVLISIITSYFSKKKYLKKNIVYIVIYVLIISLVSGVLAACFQWILNQDFQLEDIRDAAYVLQETIGVPRFFGGIIANVGLNLADKGIVTVLALLIIHLVPQKVRDELWNTGLKQRVKLTEDGNIFQRGDSSVKKHLWTKTVLMLVVGALLVAIVVSWISMAQYVDTQKRQATVAAKQSAEFTAKKLEEYDLDEFFQYGLDAENYLEAKELLYDAREASPNIKYLYLMKVEDDGFYNVIDIESKGVKAYEIREKVAYETELEDSVEALKHRQEMEPIETRDHYGWLITCYVPVDNKKLNGVYYVGADATLDDYNVYLKDFSLKLMLIFPGFFILIIVFGITYAESNLVSPINTIVKWMDDFVKAMDNQEKIDDSVRTIREVDIRTEDEIENLYKSICDMAVATSNQVRDINYFADSTAKMQNGLIITMADMVENRDSDTGAHVQKTAEYVRIISQSLKKNGYYLEKLTPKFMSDIVMSAPLHDVGKIQISDTILNKPGKLTDDEYEIMKTHTTHGKEIMEKAIVTVEGENYLKEARNMAAYHHERWDGKGYPEGLHGEVIPLSARIMAVADVFDALTSHRVYKPAFPLEKALAILEEGSGTQFDPKCVNAFMDALPEVKAVLKKYNEV